MAKKRKRKKSKSYSMTYMNRYINANINSAFGKLRRAKLNGAYKASHTLQEANSQLRALYRKYGVDENVLHGGAKFRANLRSQADLAVFFRAIKSIKEVNARALTRKYKRLKEDYADRGIDFDKQFDLLSKLSSEFHEIFAFITYGDIQAEMSSGNEDFATTEDILSMFFEETRDKYLDEGQSEKANILKGKIYSKYKAHEIAYMRGKGKGFKD